MKRWLAVFALCAVAVLAAPPPAGACSCYTFAFRVLPAGEGAPVNTRVWIVGTLVAFGDYDANPMFVPQLVGPEGEAVPTTESRITLLDRDDEAWLVVLTPNAELEPNTEYAVAHAGGHVMQEFTTGESRQLSPPVIDEVAYDGFHDEFCGPVLGVSADVQHDGAILLMDRDGRSTYDPETVSGAVASFQGDDWVSMGRGTCGIGWSDVEARSTAEVRVASLDLAGNFSGWTDGEEVRVPRKGCRVGDDTGPGWWILLFALLRRPRRAVRIRPTNLVAEGMRP